MIGASGKPSDARRPQPQRQNGEAPTAPPPVPVREVTTEELRRQARVAEEIEAPPSGHIPHWQLTLADLRQQRDALDVAIEALEALYR